MNYDSESIATDLVVIVARALYGKPIQLFPFLIHSLFKPFCWQYQASSMTDSPSFTLSAIGHTSRPTSDCVRSSPPWY